MPYGVSNSFKRGTIKTYTRKPQRDFLIFEGDFPRKRVRMDGDGTAVEEYFNTLPEDHPVTATEDRVPSSSTVPSSPAAADQDLLSASTADTAHGTESPPSSPPPRLPSPEPASKKSAFYFLKRKRSLRSHDISEPVSEPLADIAPNILAVSPRPVKRTRLTQMQIDLGGQVQKTCKACGMEYIPSNKEDTALHRDFHTMNHAGVDVGKKFLSKKDGGLKRAYPREKDWLNEGEEMVMVDRRSPLSARNKVKRVLEVANAELGSADISDEELWAPLPVVEDRATQPRGRKKKGHEAADKPGERFKAFLHLEGEKCIGFCLAEKIGSANRVVDPDADNDQQAECGPALRSSSISVSAEVDVVLLGIARIWTSKSHRGRGVATDLLETARGNFFYGLEVSKELVAFSQPTESGGKLAERWFGRKSGWHVYGEQR